MTTPAQIISRVFEKVAPLRLAEKWDNVGPLHPLSPSSDERLTNSSL
jgi:putative NIF3 family GTP cyclohydrolase 1 type 2